MPKAWQSLQQSKTRKNPTKICKIRKISQNLAKNACNSVPRGIEYNVTEYYKRNACRSPAAGGKGRNPMTLGHASPAEHMWGRPHTQSLPQHRGLLYDGLRIFASFLCIRHNVSRLCRYVGNKASRSLHRRPRDVFYILYTFGARFTHFITHLRKTLALSALLW